MPPHSVSKAIKQRIPILFHLYKYTVKHICRALGVKKSCVYQALDYFQKHQVPYNPDAYCSASGRRQLLFRSDRDALHQFLQENPCAYVDEMQNYLLLHRGISVSIPTILRTLVRLEHTLKSVSKQAIERDAVRRAIWQHRMGEIAPDSEMLVFLDEAARNEKTAGRQKGWSLRGTRCIQRRCFVRGKRYSILPALTLDGIITHDIVEGSVTAERFYTFLRDFVVRASSVPFLPLACSYC